jgi:hypothetical protein
MHAPPTTCFSSHSRRQAQKRNKNKKKSFTEEVKNISKTKRSTVEEHNFVSGNTKPQMLPRNPAVQETTRNNNKTNKKAYQKEKTQTWITSKTERASRLVTVAKEGERVLIH